MSAFRSVPRLLLLAQVFFLVGCGVLYSALLDFSHIQESDPSGALHYAFRSDLISGAAFLSVAAFTYLLFRLNPPVMKGHQH